MISEKDPLVEFHHANWLNQVIALVAPTHLNIVAGRGMTKTTGIHAERSMEAILDMPASLQMFLVNTYENARTNVIPTLIEGWQYKGWREGVHFVWGERPPANFKKPYKPVSNYKNTISAWNGATIIIGSAEQVSGLAGNSYQKLSADEVKYIEKKKLDVILPALRGNNNYPHSPYYLSTTFTTDMPNLGKGDESWILELEKESDMERAQLSYYAGHVVNEINKEIAEALKWRNTKKLKKLTANKARWMARWYRCRKDLSFFYTASSLVNADLLTSGYFKTLLKTLGAEDFKQSVFSLKGALEEGERFYTSLSEKHFYRDGENTDYSESLGLRGDPNCHVLKYLDLDKPIDAGIDFGNMMSMVIGQEHGEKYRCLKSIYKLGNENTKKLAEHFIRFFAPHREKVLYMYYDRSANQYKTIGRDWATELKNHIERDAGGSTGWKVVLMNKEQGNILQSEEFRLMKVLMEGNVEGLPKLLIDVHQCRELKSSLELAKIEVRKNSKGQKGIYKSKKSEQLPLSQLPMNSTNFSDAFKYLMYRKEWAKKVQGISGGNFAFIDGN